MKGIPVLVRQDLYRADSRFAPSQWEMALLCNDVSHLLGASLESTLSIPSCHSAYSLFDDNNMIYVLFNVMPMILGFDKSIWCSLMCWWVIRLGHLQPSCQHMVFSIIVIHILEFNMMVEKITSVTRKLVKIMYHLCNRNLIFLRYRYPQ